MGIRLANETDLNSIQELNKNFSFPWNDLAWISQKINNNTFYVSELDKVVCRAISFPDFDGGIRKIETIAVDSNFRGKYLGTKLLQCVEDLAKKDNLGCLYVNSGKIYNSLDFYKKCGFF